MLTFSFTGVDGTMTECETLTSGMVGKQVQLLFDSSWDNLSKTVVFRAADVNRVVINPDSSLVIIPEAVLARPFGKLFVGVYGTDESGTVIIPTVMAEGPMIRYGADPTEDETAKELPVWENLQNQIGDLSALETEQKENLTDAVNDLHRRETALKADVEQLQESVSYLGEPLMLETQDKTSLVGAVNELHRRETDLDSQIQQIQQDLSFIGDPSGLETADKGSLVAAVNELHRELEEHTTSYMGLTVATAQLLIDILCKGTYTEPQEEAIAALAAAWGATVPKPEPKPILHWDFRTGSLTDQIGGITATTASTVNLDEAGAHLPSSNSWILFPAGLDGASLSGHTMEVKFGQMSLNAQASTLRLVCSCLGSQPASTGIIWTGADCWSSKSSIATEFTDLHMFSGKTLYAKGAADSNRIDWYCEDQLICSTEPSAAHTHMSIGSSTNGAHVAVVEYVKIYPTV